MASPKVSLGGQTFGRLRAIASPYKTTAGLVVNTLCTCGTEKPILVANLVNGRTRSCGCLAREVSKLLSQTDEDGNLKYATLTEYWAHHSAMQRCFNPKAHAYESCGGAGVKFYEPWVSDFPRFLADMGVAKPGQILTSRDMRGDFTPENCFWSSWGDFGARLKGTKRAKKSLSLPLAA